MIQFLLFLCERIEIFKKIELKRLSKLKNQINGTTILMEKAFS